MGIAYSALGDVPPESAALFFSGLVGLFALISIPIVIRFRQRSKGWPRAIAKVTRVGLACSDMNGEWHAAVPGTEGSRLCRFISFETETGSAHTTVLSGRGIQSLAVGDTIEIIYNPEHPSTAFPARLDALGALPWLRQSALLILPLIIIVCAAVWWIILF